MALARSVVGDRRPPSRGDRQRGRIIDAVVELLAEVPIADLSVARIASRASVTRPAFYFYFETKYAAVAAALEAVWAEVDVATVDLETYEFDESPQEFNERMIGGATAVWQRHSALIRACMQGRQSDPQLEELWNRFVDNLAGKLASFIDALCAAGRIRPACDDTMALTHALLGMTIWVLHEHDDESQSISPDRLMAAVRTIWLASAWGPAPE
jgi:AcrR family transcriptional regulator